MAEIRFKNLPSLLKDMELKGWTIDGFFFIYKQVEYMVILKLYVREKDKPTKYAKASVEFIEKENTNNSIIGYIDFYDVWFNSVDEFCEFFNVEKGDANRDLFKDFSEKFAEFIPTEKITKKDKTMKALIGSRAEGNNPFAIYCYSVHRSGTKENGDFKERSPENSNKAESLRPDLYEEFYTDKTVSFYFTDDPQRNKTYDEIIFAFVNNKEN